MSIFIGIESLAANALIELLEKKQIREVAFDTLVRYGMEVIRMYEKETGEEAVLLLSREYQISMIEDYSDYFEIGITPGGECAIKIKDGIGVEDLNRYFRWTLRLKVIRAFLAPEALRALGVAA